MVSRYDGRKIGINQTTQYEELFDARAIKQIRQYFTPNLRHPTNEEIAQLQIIRHEWRVGDRYFKLASRYYNDSKLWWIIAHYNQKPTDAHLEIGNVIDIPLPLELVLKFLNM